MSGDAAREAESRPRLRSASKEDLYEVARVYLRAFPGTLQQLHAPRLSPLAVGDIMRAVLEADPGSIMVAQAPTGEVVGYILAVSDASKISHAAVFRGHVVRWLWRWARGLYRLPVSAAVELLRDKLRLRDAWQMAGADCPARIISLAVDPDWHQQGVGRRLLVAGMRRLRAQGRNYVRLEVRPGNAAARHLYEQLGFREVGRFPDTRGDWLVLVAATEPAEAEQV